MNKYENPYYRLQLYYSWFFYDEFNQRTISLLAEETDIPISIIRDDIFHLITTCPDFGYIHIDEIALEQDIFRHFPFLERLVEMPEGFSLSESEVEQLKGLFLSGSLDYIPLSSYLYSEDDSAIIHLMLEPNEYKVLTRYKEKFYDNQSSLSVPYLIKESYRFKKTPDILNKLDIINNAISLSRELHFSYIPLIDPPSHFCVKPLKILYFSNEDIYCLLALYATKLYTFRIDRISSQIHPVRNSYKLTETEKSLFEKALVLAPNVWDRNFMQFDDPVSVKIRFSKIGNVEQKVRSDLQCRTNGQIYEDDDYLYYEDDIYGLSSFVSWLNTFGRAAIVLEPRSLQESMVASIRKQLERYSS